MNVELKKVEFWNLNLILKKYEHLIYIFFTIYFLISLFNDKKSNMLFDRFKPIIPKYKNILIQNQFTFGSKMNKLKEISYFNRLLKPHNNLLHFFFSAICRKHFITTWTLFFKCYFFFIVSCMIYCARTSTNC